MATLGDLLAMARRSAHQFEGWIAIADPGLADDVRSAAQQEGCSPAAFIRSAVGGFSRFADEEDWARLTRAIRDHPDPAMACLAAMVGWRLTIPACGAHSAPTP